MASRPPRSIASDIRQQRPFTSRREEALIALLRTADGVRRAAGRVIEARGISAQQYNVLRILRGAGERGLPTLEIAERLIEQTPGITRLVDALERRKLLTRERCATDRRIVYCRIAKPGLTLLAELDAPVLASAEAAMRGLKVADMARFLGVLDRVREGLG